MNRIELTNHTRAALEGLHSEFDVQLGPEYVAAVGRAHFERLSSEARVLDFIPILVYRATRDDLTDIRADRLHDAA